jgi:hypothetical protein
VAAAAQPPFLHSHLRTHTFTPLPSRLAFSGRAWSLFSLHPPAPCSFMYIAPVALSLRQGECLAPRRAQSMCGRGRRRGPLTVGHRHRPCVFIAVRASALSPVGPRVALATIRAFPHGPSPSSITIHSVVFCCINSPGLLFSI